MNLDLIGGILISALVTAEKGVALSFLQSIHDGNVKQYKALVFSLDYGLSEAAVASTKTATQLDDQAVAALRTVLAESATQNGITI